MIVTDHINHWKDGTPRKGFYMDGILSQNLHPVPKYLDKNFDMIGLITQGGSVGGGKCQIKGSKVLLSNGLWKNIEDIKVGDLVLSPQKDGSTTYEKVISTTNWFSKDNYNVIEKNKQNKKLYSCSGNHLIPVYHKFWERGTKDGKRFVKRTWWDFKEYEAQQLFNMKSEGRSHQNIGFSTPLIDKFNGRKNCLIEPYSLGVFLGDGYSRKSEVSITSNDCEILQEISKHYLIMSIKNKQGTETKNYSFSMKGELAKQLKKHNLIGEKSGTKFIPKEALLSNAEYRKRLLAGLIDTDGYYSNGGYEFTLKSKQLIEDIRNLVYSLGGRCAQIRKVKKGIKKLNFVGTYYSTRLYLGSMKLPVQLKRKKGDLSRTYTYLEPNRIAINLKKSKAAQVYGFGITGKSNWYVTDNWMVTHNSTLATGIGLYLSWLIAGGEMDMRVDDDGKLINPGKILKSPTKSLNFSLNNFCYSFDGDDGLMEKAHRFPRKSVFVIDEGRRGTDSIAIASKLNRQISEFWDESRQYSHVYLIVCPDYFKITPDLACERSMFLINVYLSDNFDRGFFKYYNKIQKDFLYAYGKKKVGSIAKYGAGYSTFKGCFTSFFPFDMEEYLKMKRDALRAKTVVRKRDVNAIILRNCLFSMYKSTTDKTNKDIADEMSEILLKKITPRTVEHGITNHREHLEKIEEDQEETPTKN